MSFFALIGKLICRMERIIERFKQLYYNAIVNNQGGIVSGRCFLRNPENIYIGKESFINGGLIYAYKNSRIVIGDNCMISYDVHIRTDYHIYNDKDIPIKDQGMAEADIIIGNDVWIGYGAQILSGVTIGDGAVIGAGAVVTHDIEPYGVYVGVPARKIKNRGNT